MFALLYYFIKSFFILESGVRIDDFLVTWSTTILLYILLILVNLYFNKIVYSGGFVKKSVSFHLNVNESRWGINSY